MPSITRPQPIENSVSPANAILSAWNQYVMWPEVWPGVSITLALSLPTLTLSPSRTVSSTSGILAASARGATTRQLYFFFRSAMPSVWSAW